MQAARRVALIDAAGLQRAHVSKTKACAKRRQRITWPLQSKFLLQNLSRCMPVAMPKKQQTEPNVQKDREHGELIRPWSPRAAIPPQALNARWIELAELALKSKPKVLRKSK
jgi:hypothetical protein